MTESDAIVRAFTLDQVERLTGISRRQLLYWDNTKFFVPRLADENRRHSNSRIYSFRDIVCLKVLNTIRNEIRVPLPHLREVKEKLAHLGDDIWAKTTLYVLNRKVVFDNPETDQREEVVSGQAILQIPLHVVSGDMERSVRALWERDPRTIGKIERHRGIASRQPVVAGTRIPIRAIRAFKDAGYSVQQIREQYPILTEEDIQAALSHGEAA
jgi:uncharacterized protein (DUF433 family)